MSGRKNTAMRGKEEKKNTPRPLDDLLTVHEVARCLRVDDTTIRRWISNGVLDAVTMPHLGNWANVTPIA